MSVVISATESSLSQELNTASLVMIDFWAEWCGPCKRLAPVLDELARDYSQKLKVIKINVDTNQTIAEKYEVLSLPSLVFIKNNTVIDKIVGFVPKTNILAKIEQYM